MATLVPIVKTYTSAIDIDSLAVAATSGGDDFPNDGVTALYINNAGSTITLTVDSIPGLTYTITGGKYFLIPPFPPAKFNDDTSKVRLSYSSVTSVKVAAVRMR